mgnify:CR=1 FL=1
MKDMLEMSQKMRLEMGKEGRRLVEKKFSEEIVIQKTKQALSEILNKECWAIFGKSLCTNQQIFLDLAL